MITLYPVRDSRFCDDASEASMALVQKVIVALRSIRAEQATSHSTRRIRRCWRSPTTTRRPSSTATRRIIAEQGKCSEVRVRRSGASFSGEFPLATTATAMAGDVEVMVPLEGLVDASAERGRLEKEKGKTESTVTYLRRKLGNPKFTERAPLVVVDGVRSELAEAEQALKKITDALARLAG